MHYLSAYIGAVRSNHLKQCWKQVHKMNYWNLQYTNSTCWAHYHLPFTIYRYHRLFPEYIWTACLQVSLLDFQETETTAQEQVMPPPEPSVPAEGEGAKSNWKLSHQRT